MHGIAALRQGEGHHRPVEDAEDALQRPHPGEAGGAPAHAFGPGEGAQQRWQPLGDQGRRLDHRPGAGEYPELALFLQIGAGRVVLAQKALQRRVGRAEARAAFFLTRGLGAGGHLAHGRDAAGAEERAGRCRHQRRQRLQQQPTKILGSAGLHARGDFLGEKFDQQLGHGQAAAFSPAIQASQQPFARVRTRPI